MGAVLSQRKLQKGKKFGDHEMSIDDQPKENPRILPHNIDVTKLEANDVLPKRFFKKNKNKNKNKNDSADEKSGYSCLMISARDLSITWGEDPRYWKWNSLEDNGSGDDEVAELLKVCWLEIRGSYNISHLTSGVTYEVALMVMMKDSAYGWEIPVALRLTASSIQPQQHYEWLHDKLKGRWIELVVGEFTVGAGGAGYVHFSLLEYKGGKWKSGLVIKGAVIRPKK